MEKDEYDSPIAHIQQNENGIFICTLKDTRAVFGIQEMKNQFQFFIQHSQGKTFKVILDTSISLNFPTDEVFDYFIENNSPKSRFAIVTQTLPMRLLFEQIITHNKITNTLFFRSIEAAKEWLIHQ